MFCRSSENIAKTTNATYRTIKLNNHTLNTVEISKLCLCAMDDKRYILDDGLRTQAYGRCRLEN